MFCVKHPAPFPPLVSNPLIRVLLSVSPESIAVLFMMGLNGLSFGSVVTCYPTSLGFIYGLNNFSKPFAFLGTRFVV